MTAIAAAQTSVKALLGIAKTATAAAVDHQLKEKLIEIQSGILDAQQRLGDAQSERLALLEEVGQLRQRLREVEDAKAALDSYVLTEVEEGKYLYRAKEGAEHAVDHYACPACHNAGSVSILQSAKTGSQQRHYACKTCKFALSVGPSDPRQPSRMTLAQPWVRNW